MALTPREFMWLRNRHEAEREYQESLMAIPVSTLANHSFNTPKKAYVPQDFMPIKLAAKQRLEAEHNEQKRKEWTREGFAEQLTAMRKSMPLHFVVRRRGQKKSIGPQRVLVTKDSNGNIIPLNHPQE